tara:strand:+ start:127 stop:912 length:786 start_codon:yes stop_codon:yes gene_type:complete
MTTLSPIKIFKNIIKEYNYFTKRPWSLNQVGKFWDTVEEYDEYNKKLYPYFKRFTNSKKLFNKYYKNKTNLNYKILDIQTRSGVGTLYWSKVFKNSKFTCADFSDGLLKKAKNRLKNKKNCSYVKVSKENFFLKNKFDIILCYETVEHIYKFEKFIISLKKHLKKNGYMVITCPNVSWEIIHWLAAIVEFNHSEGPHRFIKLKKLRKIFTDLDLKILEYNSTILLPFNNPISIKADIFLTKILPKKLKEILMLRHTFIIKK